MCYSLLLRCRMVSCRLHLQHQALVEGSLLYLPGPLHLIILNSHCLRIIDARRVDELAKSHQLHEVNTHLLSLKEVRGIRFFCNVLSAP